MQIDDIIGTDQEHRDSEIQRLLHAEGSKPFDLKEAPLIRALLLSLSEQEHILLVTFHHSVSDGWSVGVFRKELATLYNALSQGQSANLPELPIQYADYAVWQRDWLQGEELERQLRYWKTQLADLTVLEQPTDKSRPKQLSYRGARQTIQLSAALTQSLKTLSQQQNVTLFMMLLSAFQVLLHRYSGQEDIVVGTAIAGRNRQELENLIGFFVNTLALRTDLSGTPNFVQLLSRVREVCLSAYAHQDIPFEKLVAELQVQRDMSRHPLFQVMLILQPSSALQDMQLSGLTINKLTVTNDTAKFDLALSLVEHPDGLTGVIEYSTDLFNAETITRLAGHFQTLLEAVVAHPETAIAELPLLTAPERHQLLVEWNATQTEYPKEKCIHHYFEEQVARTPDAIALVFEDQQLSYQGLNAKANQLAHYLQTLGVQPDTLVAICLDRSIDLVIGLLAILKAGGAYVPLDPTYPRERLAFMLDDSQISLLLTQKKFDSITNASELNHGIQRVYLDSEWPTIFPLHLGATVNSENLAYVIYTSGSTGKPKGVQINHRSLLNFLMSMAQLLDIKKQDVLLAVTTLSFDIAGLEIYLPLICGAKIIIASRELAVDGSGLARILNQANTITMMQATPATWRLLLEADWTGNPQLKILCGGEALNRDLAIHLQKKSKEVWNLYGPTETTIWSTVNRLSIDDHSAEVIPIGHPIANTQLYILDKHLQLAPVGVTGELHIGGDGLARGYLNRPELTAEKFIKHPFSDDPHARLYKTGDLARYLPNGVVEFLGRIDHQVKIRGFRIELGEIESVLGQHPSINEVVVTVREDQPGDKRLVVYLTYLQHEPPNVSALRLFLKQKLPEYMVPSAFVLLDKFPLTPNGKIDRKALPAPDQTRPEYEQSYVPPRSPIEEMLVAIWQEVLNIEQIGIHDNFFELGGHSLLAVQLIVRINKQFQIEFPLYSLFEDANCCRVVGTIGNMLKQENTNAIAPIKALPRKR